MNFLQCRCRCQSRCRCRCRDFHMAAFVPQINNMLQDFSSTWNNHGVRTERNRNPLQIWTEGFYRLAPTNMNGLLELTDSSLYGIDDDGPIPELKTADDIQVPERDIKISVDQENYLASTFDP